MLTIDKFLEYLELELDRSQCTVESYRRDLEQFENYARGLSCSFSWENVDADMVRNWMEEMMDKGNRATSVCRRLSALRTFFRYALSRNLIKSDPVHNLRRPKTSKPLPQFLKEEEMDRLLDGDWQDDNFQDVRARTILMIFYEVGVRVSELVGLDDEDINFAQQELKVTGKGNKQRVIPFGKELKDMLLEYIRIRDVSLRKCTSALIVTDKGKRMPGYTVRTIVKENLAKVCSLKKKSPHVLRHTFATAMLNHGSDIENLKKLLGHASVSTTEIYTHTTFEQLKRVYNEAHPRA